MSTMANDGEVLLIFRVLYTLPYRKYLMACVLMAFRSYWRVLMVYVFGDYPGTVTECKISDFPMLLTEIFSPFHVFFA
jgi:hypothetical protein